MPVNSEMAGCTAKADTAVNFSKRDPSHPTVFISPGYYDEETPGFTSHSAGGWKSEQRSSIARRGLSYGLQTSHCVLTWQMGLGSSVGPYELITLKGPAF